MEACKETHHPDSHHVIPLTCQKVAPQRQSPSSWAKTFQNQFFINQSLFAPLRTLFFMPTAFFAAASIGKVYTHLCHMHFFTEIHGSFNIFQYSAWEMFSWRQWACSKLPLLLTRSPAVCSGLLISLSYSRVSSTKADNSQPRGAFFLLNPSSPLARTGSVGCKAAQGKEHTFSCPPTKCFSESGCVATATVEFRQLSCL